MRQPCRPWGSSSISWGWRAGIWRERKPPAGAAERAIELHRHKGTPWAVRTALETALPTEASIKEWFAYGGDPFFFRVRLDVSELGLDESGMTSAVRLILDYKNVRSWLECLETFTRRPLPIAVATAGVMRTLNWRAPLVPAKTWCRPPASMWRRPASCAP